MAGTTAMPRTEAIGADHHTTSRLLLPRAQPSVGLAHRQRAADGVCRRAFDVVFAVAALLLSAPLLLVLVAAIKVSSPGPAFYSQQRVGRNGREFRCWKLRTMVVGADELLSELLEIREDLRQEFAATFKLHDDPRITAVGRFLRCTSLDELPQFLNVLRGDMSVIGPRPIVWGEAPLYGRALDRVLAVRPGLTGLWQVSGRNDVDYPTRVALQVRAAQERSVRRDALVLLRTVVLMWPGASSGGR
jgi:lipopolysaccharide/colanic/teichoic acid biosynthesis glycosyltransferase